MRNRVLKLTETAAMLALLLCLQWMGSLIPEPLTKQLVTGTLVNCVLAVTVLRCGMGWGISLALISPVFAALLGIAPQYIVVPAIMVGNCCYVILLKLLVKGKSKVRDALGLGAAAVTKFAALYLLVVQLVCNVLSSDLIGKKFMGKPLLAPKMLLENALPFMFSWPQLVTALVGGGLALAILPVLRKALHR